MRHLLLAILSVGAQVACAQLSLVPIPHTSKATVNPSARTKATLALPFWDDFSETELSAPSPDRWYSGASAWVNDGLGINPPSINVASFDGVDSLGKPYSVNDVLAKGFADKLESQPIDLSLVATAERSSVFMTFYYQMKGRGELPDAGDRLILEFRTAEKWEAVWTIENDGTLPGDVFTQVVVPISADRFYHDGFKFRFKNFSRLSGPYDTWHVDYIYINKGRSSSDTSYPDRSIVSPLTSVFDVYRAIPKEHFSVDKEEVMTQPSIVVHNLRVGNNQPLNYFSYAQVEEFKDGASVLQPAQLLDSAASIGSVNSLEYKTAVVSTENLSDLLADDADSLRINLKVGLSTKDNLPPAEDGDYDPKYAPIDFRLNDTTRAEYWLSSYYAYDDGSAEYGAALNQPGAQVAYEFTLVGVEAAYIKSLQLYFPRFGDETSQVIELRIWSNLLEQESSVLYKEVVTLQRTDENNFWLKKLTQAVRVSNKFYVGWRQSSAAVIAVGFDKNTNSSNRIHFNINGTWEQNSLLAGSLMIRPVFLRAEDEPDTDPDPIDGVEETTSDIGRLPFPNPSTGAFVIPGHVTDIVLLDISGRHVGINIVEAYEETQVTLANPTPGIYVVRYLRDGLPRLFKLMVR
jgi:hypothetical protein